MEIFVVFHWDKIDVQDIRTVGVYSSMANAETAIERVGEKPGFREAPEGFYVVQYELDQDNWTEGFAPKSSVQ